jgi:lipopolysaccharide export system protein LptA
MASSLGRLLACAVLLVVSGGALHAQGSKGPPNALQGFSQNRDQPVQIEAATLEVRDKAKEATFSGNVHVKQGDTALRCQSLVVFYEGGAIGGQAATGSTPKQAIAKQTLPPAAAPGADQRIKRLEARGGVVVTQKDHTASGELGVFDMATNTVTLTGNVVMTQGKNVLRGERLVVNLDSGVSRVESGNGRGRVQGLFQPGTAPPELKPGSIAPPPPPRQLH